MPANSPLDNLSPNQRLAVVVALVIIAGIIVLARGWKWQPGPPPGEPGQTLANRNARFGLPGEAKADPGSKDAYLIDRPQYVLSYNGLKNNPNWVSWNLKQSDIGHAQRQPRFEPDPALPDNFYHVKDGDYQFSANGFQKGHMCPSKDRSDSEENNKPTFYTTNIVPQSPHNNQKGWERFEDYCRRLTRDGSELYIVAGPHGQGGTGAHGERRTIGRGAEIVVPAAVWKVVMVLPEGDATPTRTTRTIAVWMPNDQTVGEDWSPYIVSVAQVEERTGYKFFSLVPEDVAGVIKGHVDRGP